MSVLEALDNARAARAHRLRATGIGADLIPRSNDGDPRLQGIDLKARGLDHDTRQVGIDRLDMTPDDLSPELRAIAERIGSELRDAGLEEIGRWATDALFAYVRVPNLQESTQVAMHLAWSLAVGETWAGTTDSRQLDILTNHESEEAA